MLLSQKPPSQPNLSLLQTQRQSRVSEDNWEQLSCAEFEVTSPFPSLDFLTSTFWKKDGTKFINLYAASTDFIELFTAVTKNSTVGAISNGIIDINPPESNPRGMYVSKDELHFFLIGTGARRVFRFDMTTPFDILNMVPHSISNFIILTNPKGITFNNAEDKCYITDQTNDIMEYILNNGPLDISDITERAHLDVEFTSPSPREIVLKSDDVTLFVASSSSLKVDRYIMTVPGEIDTADFIDSFDVSSVISGEFNCMHIDKTGTYLRVASTFGQEITTFILPSTTCIIPAIVDETGARLVEETGAIIVWQ